MEYIQALKGLDRCSKRPKGLVGIKYAACCIPEYPSLADEKNGVDIDFSFSSLFEL
jgi:hypothetical protein